MVMTDKQIKELIEVLSDIYEDKLDEGVHPISVASVMLAVAVKQLKRQLDENEFNAIMIDLTENQFSEWENMSDEELDELLMELDTKNDRILH